MEEGQLRPIPKKAIAVWRWRGIIQVVLAAIVVSGISYVLHMVEAPLVIRIGLIVLLCIDFVVAVIVLPTVRWRIWRYAVREHEIEIQSGIFVVKRTLIPMVRVQHVDTAQGPLLKKYRLANISISTAATTHIIPMLEVETADALRQKISTWARVAEEDV